MASDAVKKRQQLNVEGGVNARMDDKDVPETFLYKCPKCGSNRTKMVSLQIRGADEPMTNFHTCVTCGHRWTSGQ
jgi:DNA-directed RNA polymerase subunit M/transcription elongation factor TFIIS